MAKRSHYHLFLNEHKGNSAKVWEIVNELTYNKKRGKVESTKVINEDGVVITNPQAIAEEFNKYFTNLGKSMADLIVPDSSNNSNSNSYAFLSNRASDSIFLFPCSPQEVFNTIKLLKNRKATRTSNIETKFIKYANPVISKYVSDLFNYCLSEGVYPDSLKVAEVTPIFKKGDHDKTSNYRPISLLSQFNKILKNYCILEFILI